MLLRQLSLCLGLVLEQRLLLNMLAELRPLRPLRLVTQLAELRPLRLLTSLRLL